MKVIVIRTNSNIEVKNLGDDTLRSMQEVVGGYIEPVRPRAAYEANLMIKRTCFVCDEEGLCKSKRINLLGSILYNGKLSPFMQPIAGDIFLVGEDEEDFRSLRDDEVNHYLNVLGAIKQASLNFFESVR